MKKLADLNDISLFPAYLPGLILEIKQELSDLYAYRIPIEDLTIAQGLSRDLESYRVPSPAARAARQLHQLGKEVRPGQRIRFLYTLGEPGVYAWDSSKPFTPEMLDLDRYRTLLLRAVHTVLGPFGVDETVLENWLISNAGYGAPVGVIPSCDAEIPLMTALRKETKAHPVNNQI